MTWGSLNPHPPTSDFQVGDRVVVTGKPFGYLKGAHLFHKYLLGGVSLSPYSKWAVLWFLCNSVFLPAVIEQRRSCSHNFIAYRFED